MMNKKLFISGLTGFMVMALAFSIVSTDSAFAKSGSGRDGADRALEVRSGSRGGSDLTASGDIRIKDDGEFKTKATVVNSVNVGARTINVFLFGSNRDVSLANALLRGRDNQVITMADIKAGDVVRLRGTFNSASNFVTVTEVQNRSLRLPDVNLLTVADRDTLANAIQVRLNNLRAMVLELEAQLRTLGR